MRYRKLLGLLSAALFSTVLIDVALASVTGSLLPTSDGNYLQWTPSTGSTHYTLVDESSCNGTTDYVYTATTGYRDSYGISVTSVPNGASITQIDLTPCASRNSGSGGGSSTLNVFYRFNGQNSSDAGNYSLSGTTPTALSAASFTSLNLLKTSTSTLEIGAIYTAGTRGARLSRIAATVTYTVTAPNAPSSLDAVTNGNDAVLTWTDNSINEDGFKIERGADGINFTQVATTTPNTTSSTSWTDVAPGTGTFYYRVKA